MTRRLPFCNFFQSCLEEVIEEDLLFWVRLVERVGGRRGLVIDTFNAHHLFIVSSRPPQPPRLVHRVFTAHRPKLNLLFCKLCHLLN